MSLVNDMLRDLDSRRREGPGHGLGSEKLVPAVERVSPNSRSSRGQIVSIVLGIALAGMLVWFFIMQGRSDGRIPNQVQSPVIAQADPAVVVSADQELPEADLIALAAATAQAAAQQAATQTLSQLESRLQQLEAQNRALLESQQREAELASSYASLPPPATALSRSSTYLAVEEDAWIDPEWANAPALPAETSSTVAGIMPGNLAQSSMNNSIPVNRVPREMSLQDRDRQAVQYALQQWSSGQRLAALQTLDLFAYQNPEAHGARETLAKLLMQQGEPERAMQAVELGLSIAPHNNAYKKIKARLDIEQGRAEDALRILSAAPPSVEADTEFHDLMATAFLTTQQYDFASVTYQALLQQNSAEGRWWYGLAASYDARGNPQDAALAYERALQQINLSPSLRQASQARLQMIRQSSAAR